MLAIHYRLSFLVFPLLGMLFFLTACERRQVGELQPKAVCVYKAGEFKTVDKGASQKTIFLDVRDETGNLPLTPVILRSLLEGDNFSIVDAPSKAAYILTIAILEEGSTTPDNVEELVDKGYGTEATFSPGDSSGWIADALLVKRRVPSEKRPSQERLKNISRRNALESSQLRIGLATQGNLENRPQHISVFGAPLARALHAALVGKADGGFE